jgi:hypothetical protein
MPEKTYETIEREGNWYLVTPKTELRIYEDDQVGSLPYRIQGILDEPPALVDAELERIIKDAQTQKK